MTSTLRTLLDRVEKGEGRDLSLEGDLLRVLLGDDLRQWPKRYLGLGEAITSSIDAAVDLVEKVLPGWVWTMAHWWCEGDSKPPFYADLCELEKAKADDDTAIIARAWSSSPARAIVAALLRAKIAQEEGA